MTEFSDFLCSSGIDFARNYDLSRASSFRIGGMANIAILPKNGSELVSAIVAAKEFNLKFEIIGNGSNVLFSDEGYRGAVIFTHKLNTITCEGHIIKAMSGAKLSSIANLARDNSLQGLEFAHGIPGTLGGALVMNAGAYGGSISDVVISSRAFDIVTNEIKEINLDEHKFDYRKSIYGENKALVCIDATLKLKSGNISDISSTMKKLSEVRREKQPLEFPSCGSFFKRPEGHFAGKLIEDAGLKGKNVGGAMVSPKHAGFIINTGGATAKDVITLASLVECTVYEKFGVKLEREVKYIV